MNRILTADKAIQVEPFTTYPPQGSINPIDLRM